MNNTTCWQGTAECVVFQIAICVRNTGEWEYNSSACPMVKDVCNNKTHDHSWRS
eukprot:m.801220 g.801220  ORF g.801220 m.801220 type:complete len:54 (-) comp23357_c1_seq7:188-349(-)